MADNIDTGEQIGDILQGKLKGTPNKFPAKGKVDTGVDQSGPQRAWVAEQPKITSDNKQEGQDWFDTEGTDKL